MKIIPQNGTAVDKEEWVNGFTAAKCVTRVKLDNVAEKLSYLIWDIGPVNFLDRAKIEYSIGDNLTVNAVHKMIIDKSLVNPMLPDRGGVIDQVECANCSF